MTDITRLLEIPVEATSIVQIFALLHVVWKKKEKKERKNVNAASIEPVTSLDKCRVTFYWVIKCHSMVWIPISHKGRRYA
jgi:hypothetical protein